MFRVALPITVSCSRSQVGGKANPGECNAPRHMSGVENRCHCWYAALCVDMVVHRLVRGVLCNRLLGHPLRCQLSGRYFS